LKYNFRKLPVVIFSIEATFDNCHADIDYSTFIVSNFNLSNGFFMFSIIILISSTTQVYILLKLLKERIDILKYIKNQLISQPLDVII